MPSNFQTYALHVASALVPGTRRPMIASRVLPLPGRLTRHAYGFFTYHTPRPFDDWSSPVSNELLPHQHAIVTFSAQDFAAYAIGVNLYLWFRDHRQAIAPLVSCHPSRHEPYAVTSCWMWGAKFQQDGTRDPSCADDWQSHDDYDPGCPAPRQLGVVPLTSPPPLPPIPADPVPLS